MDGLERQEILTKAVNLAIANGWDKRGMDAVTVDASGQVGYMQHGMQYYDFCPLHTIMAHDFAKALWGEEHQHVGHENTFHEYMTIPAWEWHLQMMVVAADPIKYLGKHI